MHIFIQASSIYIELCIHLSTGLYPYIYIYIHTYTECIHRVQYTRRCAGACVCVSMCTCVYVYWG